MVLFAYSEVRCLKGASQSTKGIITLKNGSKILCGRSEDANIRINSDMISRRHALLQQKEDDTWSITDLQSLNGVFVNGRRLKPHEHTELNDGDRVQLGVASSLDTEPEFIWIYYTNYRVKKCQKTKDAKTVSSRDDAMSCVSADCEIESSNPGFEPVSSAVLSREPHQDHALGLEQEIRHNSQEFPPSLSMDESEKPKLLAFNMPPIVSTMGPDSKTVPETNDGEILHEKFKHEKLLLQKEQRLAQLETELRDKERRNKELEMELGRKQRHLNSETEKENKLKDQSKEITSDPNTIGASLHSQCGLVRQTEEQRPSLSSSPEHSNTTNNDSQLRRAIGEVMETELQCSICSELIIKAVSINCSHSFCQYCLEKWMKIKHKCPICRTTIVNVVHSILLDNYIDRMINDHFSEEMKTTREALIKERQDAHQQLPSLAENLRPSNIIHQPMHRPVTRRRELASPRFFVQPRSRQPADFREDRLRVTRIRRFQRSSRRNSVIGDTITISDESDGESSESNRRGRVRGRCRGCGRSGHFLSTCPYQ